DHGSPRYAERARLADGERLAEDLRLAYVALTRARLRCYVGWGAINNAKLEAGAADSALGYLLRDAHEPGDAAQVAERTGQTMAASLGAWEGTLRDLVAASGGAMSMEVLADDPGMTEWRGASVASSEPVCRVLVPADGQLSSWSVASFTSLVAGQHAAASPLDDARDVSDHAAVAPPPARARDDVMAFPAGREAGTALHELLERADFDADADALRALAAEVLVRHRLASDAADGRVDAAVRMVAGTLAASVPTTGFALREVPRRRTLREWAFHLPLGRVGRATLADLFARHGGDVARRYVPALRALAPRETRGFLTGVVDLALEHGGRWWVVDWKSNHLGAEPAAYEGAALEGEMVASHYVLQYHLYVVALHRFLRARLPGYDYDAHVGGAAYAFLRGCDGDGRGWFVDRPPRALVDALDALVQEGAA
ncbi:MAG TPA: PD-(D/E)XK nuclease family protein, partial [Gemmatimonadaceae bacterium]|nr:PD-(D/E)XK nuclease family protein [Gemmatimonadaceae bacterium]